MHVVRVARELKRRGWNPEVFALLPEGPLAAELDEAGIPVYGVRASWCRKFPILRVLAWLPMTMLSLVSTMATRRPSACHFFLPAAYLVGGIAAVASGRRPRIMSRRSLRDYQDRHPVLAILEHRLHRHMDLVCGNSNAVVRQLSAEGIPAERLRLIYNGVPASSLPNAEQRASFRHELGIGPDVFVVVVVANLIHYKGHADLISALTAIRSELPQPWLLLAAGRDDGIGASLAQSAGDAGIGPNIRWLGSRSDVPALLAASDLAVLPSHQEGFSNAILEAMAAGLPTVVTDAGGNAEAVVNGVTGYVVPPQNPKALAEAIRCLSLDPRRAEFGERGRQRLVEEFSLKACVDAYESLYHEVGAA